MAAQWNEIRRGKFVVFFQLAQTELVLPESTIESRTHSDRSHQQGRCAKIKDSIDFVEVIDCKVLKIRNGKATLPAKTFTPLRQHFGC